MKRSGNLYSHIATFFMIITVIVIIVIVHITLALATIKIPAKVENFILEAPIEITNSAGPDEVYGETASIDLEQQKVFSVSGKLITSDTASATITITNTTARPQTLVKTTRFLSADNKLFRLAASTTVPANGTIGALIVADKPGTDYQVAAGRFTIPGLPLSQQDKIYGQSDKPASMERPEALTLGSADVDQARKSLLEGLKQTAAKQLKTQMPTALDLSPDHIVATVINEKIDPGLGTKTQQFSYQVEATFTTMIFEPDRLLLLATDKLQEKLPSSASLLQIKNDSFTYSLTDFNTTTASATAKIHLEASIASNNTINDFIDPSVLVGKTAQEAQKYLNDQGVKNAQVVLFPFWVRHIPRLVDHIKIEMINPDQANSN
ncbi:MAG: hypothetical protein V1846_04395 [Candidatus Komeilibacteria bacterium]